MPRAGEPLNLPLEGRSRAAEPLREGVTAQRPSSPTVLSETARLHACGATPSRSPPFSKLRAALDLPSRGGYSCSPHREPGARNIEHAMKISAIEITHHRLPLDPPFRPSWDFRPRERFEATIVRVRTDEDLE